MFLRTAVLASIGVFVLSGILLTGQNCQAQTDPCTPDPCQGISNAVPDTCTPIGGSCTPATDFTCGCEAGFGWQDVTNMCEERPSGPMAEIPTGCFDMGGGGYPVHNVCISSFYMDALQVTNAEYRECVDDGGCTAPHDSSSSTRTTYYGNSDYDDFPVIHVDWHQATDYCTWAGKRLPTEAEWEYAARGGLSGKSFPWGDGLTGADANYHNSGDPWDDDTTPVGYYAPQATSPNGYGLYDMLGNVWEWVNDWYQTDYYSVSPTNDPPGPVSGTNRVLRGASWNSARYTGLLQISYRTAGNPGAESQATGFRCARGGAYGP